MPEIEVLFIAYQFPPRGGPGVHRSINFVKYLPDFNYKPVVLTVREHDYIVANEQLDQSLLSGIPDDTPIVRTKSYQPIAFINLMNKLKIFRLFWYVFYPFFWERMALWPWRTYKVARNLVKRRGISLIYTTSGPFSSLILGHLLKKRLQVRWVADLRDPFTDAYAWMFPSKLHWYFARFFEKRLLSKADVIIVNTPEVKKLFIKRGIAVPEKIEVITNGF